jgi:hypothetical protein
MKNKRNYFQIHKNKGPKYIRKKKKYVSYLIAKLALLQMNSYAQIKQIQDTPIPNYKDPNKSIDKGLIYAKRCTKIIEVIDNSTKTIIEIFKEEKQLRFQKTKRYIK